MIEVLYLQLLKWGNKIEKYKKSHNTIIITVYKEPECYVNDIKPHSYKLLTEYSLNNSKICIKSGYDNGKIRNIYFNTTRNAKYYLRPI